jgi:hypothetical protein
MLQVEKQEDIELGLAYLDKKEICNNFWSKLRRDNISILK